jgi:hypothetical protein
MRGNPPRYWFGPWSENRARPPSHPAYPGLFILRNTLSGWPSREMPRDPGSSGFRSAPYAAVPAAQTRLRRVADRGAKNARGLFVAGLRPAPERAQAHKRQGCALLRSAPAAHKGAAAPRSGVRLWRTKVLVALCAESVAGMNNPGYDRKRSLQAKSLSVCRSLLLLLPRPPFRPRMYDRSHKAWEGKCRWHLAYVIMSQHWVHKAGQ